ncbi:MAG: hypothetical protein IGS50_13655 [Synechococcales cyanobacterium C42_A2020_086]|nr:hypothetical protein [Synechococcales cyanobacterium M58_A2018_015]MBF2074791.1 hypothetical protein [Synechococcales cyanobacterium C42_A2020_086]
MSKNEYGAMTDQELKQYFLDHCDNKAALQAYLIRVNKRPHEVIATVDGPDFDAKVQAAIL